MTSTPPAGPTAPSPAPAPQPADEAQGYPQSAPQQGQGSPQPPQASPQMQQGQPQMQQPQPVQPQPVPQPIPGQPSAPEPAPAHHGIAEDDPEWQRIAQEPATEGSRGSWNRRLGMKLKPSEEELAARRARLAEERSRAEEERRAEAVRQEEEQRASSRREARRRQQEQRRREQREVIQTNFQGARTILIANPKGGARKTTSTYLLAATMGIVRGGSVVAWDANETMGTLGDRSRVGNHTRTVVDLLHGAEGLFSSIEGSRLGALDAFVRPQGDSHFDVLASDEDPTRQDIVDAKGFATVHEILTRFYRLILVDTGNNMRTGHFQAALEAADQLVIPVAASHDSARVAQQMMKALVASGHEELVRSAVVLMHELEPEGSPDGPAVAQELADAFAPQVAEVLPIPFDDALKRGGAIDYATTSESTQNAYLDAATAVARGVQQAAQNREEKSADGDA
ncbi:hypothetical protein [Brachybacterium sp. Marseille-Q7125]|uniref:MinD/ParA family ATP-binding protein n=1 Tax=Brachybacterium sp. Marseille-Q7125 TaxID=2932815 RepID=UPI001FF235AF|nr:hypothetical protein [Brachybacterium sp. Marseille-Q7125]